MSCYTGGGGEALSIPSRYTLMLPPLTISINTIVNSEYTQDSLQIMRLTSCLIKSISDTH